MDEGRKDTAAAAGEAPSDQAAPAADDAPASGPGATDSRTERRQHARERRHAAADEPFEPIKRSFEFSAAHNPKFARLASLMQVVGLIYLAGALLIVALVVFVTFGTVNGPPLQSVLPFVLLNLVSFAATLAVGLWTMRAGRRFELIAKTQGSDVSHLMSAIGELTKLYGLQIVAFVLGVAAAVISYLVRAQLPPG